MLVKETTYKRYDNKEHDLLTMEFNSIDELAKYINNNEVNKYYVEEQSSQLSGTSDFDFTGTINYEQANELLEYGWSVKAKEINVKLNGLRTQNRKSIKTKFSVEGFQASVPRYLQGMPDNMISQVKVERKNKVITINKLLIYNHTFKVRDIEEQNLLFLSLVDKLESQGYKVNIIGIYIINFDMNREYNVDGWADLVIKIKLKSANEKLNVSKLAFPLVHPSMFRRIIFRLLEILPEEIINKLTDSYSYYGANPPVVSNRVSEVLVENKTNEYVFYSQLNNDDLKKLLSEENELNEIFSKLKSLIKRRG